MKITAKQYAQALHDLTEEKDSQAVDGVVSKFAKELSANNQLGLLENIIEKFNEIWNKRNGIVEAEIISARELESSQVSKAESYIKEKYGARKVVLSAKGGFAYGGKNRIDKSLKGGIIIKVGDEVIDGSVKKKLVLLKESLRK